MKGNLHPRAVLKGAWLLAMIVAACGGDDGKSEGAAGGTAPLSGTGGSPSGGGSAGQGPAPGGSDSGGTGMIAGASNGGSAAGETADAGAGGTTSGSGGSSGSGGASGGSGPVVPTCLKSVGLGDVYVCVVDADGTAACRGKNESGQLGIGNSPSSSDTFRAVGGFDAAVTSVWTGYGENYAVTGTGKVFRWGYVDFLTKDEVVPKPVDFSAQLPNAAKVLSGASHRCALNADKSLVCWGANNFNQLGDGSSSGHVEPMEIAGLEAILDIAVGYEHSCAIKSDHTLWCWGDNRLGQLGNGTTDEVKTPTQVTSLGTSVTQVATRHDYSCALTDDGKVSCWGREGYDDDQGNPTPGSIDALGDDVSAIAVGDWHICALKEAGQVWCWAQDITSTGKTPAIASKTPAAVPGLASDVTDIWAGYFSTCARRKDGSVWCWGSDLGLSTTPKQLAAGCK